MKSKGLLIGGLAAVVIAVGTFFVMGSGGGNLNKASEALNNGEPEQAIEILKQITEKKPKNAEAWLMLGDAYREIETYGMPMGDTKNGVKAYWEGYKLGNDECRKRLAWVTCPLVSIYMGGIFNPNDKGGSWFTEEDIENAVANYDSVNANPKSTDKEKQDAALWVKIVRALNGAAFFFNSKDLDTVWLDVLVSGQLTDEDYLFMGYISPMLWYWDFFMDEGAFGWGYMPSIALGGYDPQPMLNMVQEQYGEAIKEALDKGLKNNTPAAIEINYMNTIRPLGHWCMEEMASDEDESVVFNEGYLLFTEAASEHNKALFSIKDKLTNNGKLLLMQADINGELTRSEYLKLIEDSVKGPYALSRYPEMAFARKKTSGVLDETTFNQIVQAIYEARYTENGGQWKEIIAKSKIEPRINGADGTDYYVPRLEKSRTRGNFPWLMFMFPITLKFVDDPDMRTDITIPIRYNSLKDVWEPILGRGYVEWRDGDSDSLFYASLRRTVYAKEIVENAPFASDWSRYSSPDELPAWAIEILKPEGSQAVVKR